MRKKKVTEKQGKNLQNQKNNKEIGNLCEK